MPRTWSAVLARIGVPTGDGRILAPGGGTSRALPLPISYQSESGEGHGGSVVVARMESISFGDGMVTATGSLLDSAPWEMIEQLEAGVIGPSVDLDDLEYVMDENELLVLTKWRVAGATLVAIPAFADVSLTLDPLPAEPVTVPENPDEYEAVGYWSTERLAELSSFGLAQAAPPAAPVLPPLDAFRKPDVDRLTPLTVVDTGQGWTKVFGHIGGWDTCHVGLPGCVTPPASMSNYAYFLQSSQLTAEGTELPVGTLVAGPRHADAQLAFHAATQHYDDPSAAVARVMAGEDEFGIWVAGWMLPGASEEARKTFLSSPVSGDWRRVGGNLELIAVCSVNSAGFPVPRARVAFSGGRQRTLIGSFGVTPVALGAREIVGTEAARARALWAWHARNEG